MKELQSLSKSVLNRAPFENLWYHGTVLIISCRYKHRNILSLVAVSNDGPRPCLVYEYMENGSLADCLMGQVRKITLI